MTKSTISYNHVSAEGGKLPALQLNVMILLTKLVAPWARMRGLGIIATLFNQILNGKNTYTKVCLNNSTKFLYPTYDSYWAYFVHSNKIYEQSLVIFLEKISSHQFCFIDCGANYGYWSAIMSSDEFNSHDCLAIEASSDSFEILDKTASINEKRFRCLQRAVYCENDKKISFTEGGRHAGRHVIDGSIEKLNVNSTGIFTPKGWMSEVQTITLDKVVDDFFPGNDSFVIKLDVEGAEIESIKGAKKLSSKNCIFIYEDFGGDKDSAITDYFLTENFQIYYPDETGCINQISDTLQLKKMKKNKRMGYDLIAVKGDHILANKVRQLYIEA